MSVYTSHPLDKLCDDVSVKINLKDRQLDFDIIGAFKAGVKMGEGSFGEVRKVTWIDLAEPYAAVKRVEFSHNLLMEMAMLKKLSHKNISPNFYACEYREEYIWKDKTNPQDGKRAATMVYIAQELLFNDFDSVSVSAEFETIKELDLRISKYLNIIKGFAILNDLGFIHSDMKPGNIMLNYNKNRIYMIDFGVVQRLTGTFRLAGSPFFMSPNKWKGPYNKVQDDFYAFALTIAVFESSYDEIFAEVNEPCLALNKNDKKCFTQLPRKCFQGEMTTSCKNTILKNAKRVFHSKKFGEYDDSSMLTYTQKTEAFTWNFTTLLVNMIKYTKFDLTSYETYEVMQNIMKNIELKKDKRRFQKNMGVPVDPIDDLYTNILDLTHIQLFKDQKALPMPQSSVQLPVLSSKQSQGHLIPKQNNNILIVDKEEEMIKYRSKSNSALKSQGMKQEEIPKVQKEIVEKTPLIPKPKNNGFIANNKLQEKPKVIDGVQKINRPLYQGRNKIDVKVKEIENSKGIKREIGYKEIHGLRGDKIQEKPKLGLQKPHKYLKAKKNVDLTEKAIQAKKIQRFALKNYPAHLQHKEITSKEKLEKKNFEKELERMEKGHVLDSQVMQNGDHLNASQMAPLSEADQKEYEETILAEVEKMDDPVNKPNPQKEDLQPILKNFIDPNQFDQKKPSFKNNFFIRTPEKKGFVKEVDGLFKKHSHQFQSKELTEELHAKRRMEHKEKMRELDLMEQEILKNLERAAFKRKSFHQNQFLEQQARKERSVGKVYPSISRSKLPPIDSFKKQETDLNDYDAHNYKTPIKQHILSKPAFPPMQGVVSPPIGDSSSHFQGASKKYPFYTPIIQNTDVPKFINKI